MNSSVMAPVNEMLHDEMRQFLHIDGRQRLYACWNRVWVPTSTTKEAFVALQDCLNAPPSTKPRGMIITGEPDTGKSSTLKAFRDAHPPCPNAESEYAAFPVIYITAPDNPSKTAVMKKILDEMGFPLTYNATEENLKAFVVKMIRGCEIQTIIIDELHDIQREYLSGKVVEFMRFIKNLINETGRPFIVAGTPVIIDLIASDEQMAGRLNTVVRLKPFSINEFIQTLLAFERMLPLRSASNFRQNESIIQFAYSHSQGFIGRLSNLLHDACKVAIETGEERVTLDVLKKVQDRSIEAVGRRS